MDIQLTLTVNEESLKHICNLMKTAETVSLNRIEELHDMYKKCEDLLQNASKDEKLIEEMQDPISRAIALGLHMESKKVAQDMVNGGMYQKKLHEEHAILRMNRKIIKELKECFQQNFCKDETPSV